MALSRPCPHGPWQPATSPCQAALPTVLGWAGVFLWEAWPRPRVLSLGLGFLPSALRQPHRMTCRASSAQHISLQVPSLQVLSLESPFIEQEPGGTQGRRRLAGAIEAPQTASCPWGAGGLDCEEESKFQGMGTGCTSPEGLESHAAGEPGPGGRGGCCPGLKEGSWGPGQGTKTWQAQTDLTSGAG